MYEQGKGARPGGGGRGGVVYGAIEYSQGWDEAEERMERGGRVQENERVKEKSSPALRFSPQAWRKGLIFRLSLSFLPPVATKFARRSTPHTGSRKPAGNHRDPPSHKLGHTPRHGRRMCSLSVSAKDYLHTGPTLTRPISIAGEYLSDLREITCKKF